MANLMEMTCWWRHSYFLPGFRHQCNNVREKEGRGEGWLRRLVLYFKSKQSTSNINLHSGTLKVPHAHNLSLRAFSRWSACTSSPPRFLSPARSSDTLFYPVSPRSSLQSDTGVITLHLTHLLTAHLPSLSPADPAEPRPPRHSYSQISSKILEFLFRRFKGLEQHQRN